MHDTVIRESLYSKVLSKYTLDTNTKVIDEFKINHGSSRADIAVVNGIMHGYEIKSDFDNLDRLPSQAEAYSKIFDKVTLVVGTKHLDKALKIIPSWWGVTLAVKNSKNLPKFESYRRAILNKEIDANFLTKLLWRSEAIDILLHKNIGKSILRQDRSTLYKEICLHYSTTEIRKIVHQKLKERKFWRDR